MNFKDFQFYGFEVIYAERWLKKNNTNKNWHILFITVTDEIKYHLV